MGIDPEFNHQLDRWADDVEKEWVEKARSETVNDTIRYIEAARPPLYKPRRTTYHYRCFNCGAFQPKSFTETGSIGQDKQADPCGQCGTSPWLGPETYSLNIVGDIAPYFDISLGQKARGALYVKGQGHLITGKSHLREFARANGREWR